jgi:hypothetical protein
MRPLNALLAALLALANACAPALARDATGGAAPVQIKRVTTEEAQDPAIAKPKPPGWDCSIDVSTSDAGKIREASGITQLGKSCVPQADAFKRSAEAASYLAFYQQNLSQYGMKMQDPDTRKRIAANVAACLNNDPSCDDTRGTPEEQQNAHRMKGDLLQALVQYNFGKEVRAQMLENQTRAQNMKTLDLPPDELKAMGLKPREVLSHNHRLGTGHAVDGTFLLDPSTITTFDPTKLSGAERAKLGQEFNLGFNQFVNDYTQSTQLKSRWAYVPVKRPAAGGGNVWVTDVDYRNLDAREGKAMIDKGRLGADIRTQSGPEVEEIVKGFREKYKDVVATPETLQKVHNKDAPKDQEWSERKVDSMKAAYQDTGFGLPESELARIGTTDGPRNEHDVAAGVALTINKVFHDKQVEVAKQTQAENLARYPSSAGSGAGAPMQVAPSITVDVKAFDNFLDEIWPTGQHR